MRIRLTIGRKITFGFAALLITTLVVFLLTYDTLRTGRKVNDRINTVYNPSVAYLEQLKSIVLRSRTLINMWAYVQSREDNLEKQALIEIVEHDIPAVKEVIDSISLKWTDAERLQKERIYSELDELLAMYNEVQTTLNSMQSYDDPLARFSMTEYAEEGGLIFQQAREVTSTLTDLIEEQRRNTTADSVTMITSFDKLEGYLRNAGIGLAVFGIIIAIITSRSITVPVRKLRLMLLALGKGEFPKQTVVDTGDEVGEMSVALEQLITGLKRTTLFANEVGKGNFETDYQPLSEQDVLGNALLSMRDGLQEYERQLKENEQQLELKVQQKTREVVLQKDKIERQNKQTKELLENITASIRYAKRLQETILPRMDFMQSLIPSVCIYYKPKDIVSGDFYYMKEAGEQVIFAAVDCTGHGVPGAFMSLVAQNALNHAVAKVKHLDPAEILNEVSLFSAEAMNRKLNDNTGRDGMDIALCIYHPKRALLKYAGAFNPLYHVRNGQLKVIKADKIVIGDPGQTELSYTSHTLELASGDTIFISTDGYMDQFGGERGRKFMYRPFRELLLRIATLPAEAQAAALEETMEEWRSAHYTKPKYEQVDDMLIIGMRQP